MADIKYPRKDNVKGTLVDMRDGSHEPPFDLMTDGGDGEFRRLRVDVGQTGFFKGTEFRTIYQADLGHGTYHYRLRNLQNQSVNVIFSDSWEERE